jgi:hypothetical protein
MIAGRDPECAVGRQDSAVAKRRINEIDDGGGTLSRGRSLRVSPSDRFVGAIQALPRLPTGCDHGSTLCFKDLGVRAENGTCFGA